MKKAGGAPGIPEENAGQPELVALPGQLVPVDPGGAEYFKRPGCPPALRDVRPLQTHLSWIDRRRVECGHVRRGNNPGQTRFIKPHPPTPALHRHDREVSFLLVAPLINHKGELSHRHPMSLRDLIKTDERAELTIAAHR